MVKIAVTSQESGINAAASQIFGRCPFFVIVEAEGEEVKEVKSLENTAVSQPGGAGIMAAQTIGNEAVQAIVTGAMGPRAFGVLQELGIEVFQSILGSVEENAKAFLEGKLEKITQPGPMGLGPGKGTGLGTGAGTGAGRGMGSGAGRGAGRGR